MKTRFLSGMLAVIMVCALVGCGTKESKGEGTETKETKSEDKIVISVGFPDNADTPNDKSCQLWKEKLEEMSGGTMTMDIYPSDQLGSKNDLIDQMMAGQPVITIADGAFYADRGAHDMGIVFGPYLFDNWDECWTLVESQWWKDQCEILSGFGITIVADNWTAGARHTMTTFPVEKPEDLKNKKIRVPDNTIQIKQFESLGAVAVPLNLTDVYTGLQQGTIEGVENPLIMFTSNAFYEVAKYVVLDAHVLNFSTWCTGTQFYDTLTDEQKMWLTEAGKEAGLYSQEQAKQTDEECLQDLKDAGVTITELSAEEREAFKKESLSFYEDPQITKDWSDNLYDIVQDAMGK